MNPKKRTVIISIVIIINLILILFLVGIKVFLQNENIINFEKVNGEIVQYKKLPKPEITGGKRGELGIDKNINESNIDEYLNREDSVYRDMRMLEDPGNYESIGGDSFLSGYIEGFEIIPLPYIIPVTGLPDTVGDTYTGITLFYNDNGTYVANFEESMNIIEKFFPKDKIIFLMCGGGGYAGMMKNFLISLGWDENKIYNVGGYWYYNGNHNINVKNDDDDIVSYNFSNLPYYNIEFNKLTKSANYKLPIIKVTELKINTSKIELEKGASFKLNAIVLPNEATNKEVKWLSSNDTIAVVSNDGLVKAIEDGKAIITAESSDGSKKVSCEITVRKKEVDARIKLDDISKEAEEFNSKESIELEKENERVTGDSKYNDENDVIYLWRKERVNLLNKLIDDKKSFVILFHKKDCDCEENSIIENAQEILKFNNISYLYSYSSAYFVDETLEKSNLDADILNTLKGSSLIIVNKGEIYESTNPDYDSLKNYDEVKNWLSKYIYID